MSNIESYRLIESFCECGDQAVAGTNSKCPTCYWEDETSRLYQEIESVLKILLNKKRVEYAQGYDLVETAIETMAKLEQTKLVLIEACQAISDEGCYSYADELLIKAGIKK